MTDPDFASFGEPNRSRPEGYRLTHPRNEPAAGSANGLTGFDPGRGSLGRPEVAVGWTPADPAPEWATGTAPSVPPSAQPPGGTGQRGHSRPESLISSPDSVAIRPDIGATISDAVSIRRQSENSPGGTQSPSGPASSEFSAFEAPTTPDPGGIPPAAHTPHNDTAAPTADTPPPTTEFGAPAAPKPSNPGIDPAFRIDSEPSGESPGLPRRTPGLPHRFSDSDESDRTDSQPFVNLLDSQLDSQFDSPPPTRRKSSGSGSLTNGSAFTSAETSQLTDNSLLATAERESTTTAETPASPAEFGARATRSTTEPIPAPLPAGTPPAADSTTPSRSADRASRNRTTSELTIPEPTDTAAAPAPNPAPPRSRLSRKAAERAAEEAAASHRSTEETTSRTTESATTIPRRARTAPRTEQRRTPPQDDLTPSVDVHLVMHLLLASHTLENIADKAEAGEVSLEEFIRAARRTRTAAVDLVSAWFGGVDQMRQFAEALLAASESI